MTIPPPPESPVPATGSSAAQAALTKLKAWPLWAKIAAPIVALMAVGALAGGNSDKADPTPTSGVRSLAEISATTSTDEVTTTESSIVTTTTEATTTTLPPTTVPPTTVPPTTTPRPIVQATTPATSPPATQPPVTNPPSDVYYKNCAAVRAAGAAPIHRGEPGYRSGLDRDGDGVGCE